MITITKEVEIARPPQEVFAFLDDEANSPKWLAQCVGLRRTTEGPKGVGSKLDYHYRSMGHEDHMDGEVVAYQPGQRLAMRYVDKLFDLKVSFELALAAAGTRLRQTCEVEPRGMAKMMTPMIEGAMEKQMAADLGTLKQLLEAGSAAVAPAT
jgi:uncharacterized protein YndB with AHSA1/START domain